MVVIVQRVLPFLAIFMSFDLTGYFLSKYLEDNLLISPIRVNEVAKFNSISYFHAVIMYYSPLPVVVRPFQINSLVCNQEFTKLVKMI